jgi:hypothetical protein
VRAGFVMERSTSLGWKLDLVEARRDAVASAAALRRAWSDELSNALAGVAAITSLFFFVVALTPGMNKSSHRSAQGLPSRAPDTIGVSRATG